MQYHIMCGDKFSYYDKPTHCLLWCDFVSQQLDDDKNDNAANVIEDSDDDDNFQKPFTGNV